MILSIAALVPLLSVEKPVRQMISKRKGKMGTLPAVPFGLGWPAVFPKALFFT
jgi:hypothetical protein